VKNMSEKKKLSAKRYLQQLEIIDMMINQDLERLDDMKTDACSTGGIDYSRDRVQTSMSGDSIGNSVVRYMTLNDEINAEIETFSDAKNQIIQEIRGLKDKNYINILYKIYVQFKSIKIASGEMRKSYSYVLELHKKALAEFEETYINLYYLT
jgi:hypothetical protein